MGRKAGSKNKTQSNSTEVVEKRPPGRQKGQKIEKEPSVIISLNSQYRVKIDKLNKTLQQRGKSEVIDGEENENEDKDWKNLGHFNKWQFIFSKLVDVMTKEKCKKAEILPFEKYLELFEKSTAEARKMFGKIDMVEM